MLKCANMQYKPMQIHHLLSLPGEGAVPLEVSIKNCLSCREGPRLQAVLARLYQIPAKVTLTLTILKATL